MSLFKELRLASEGCNDERYFTEITIKVQNARNNVILAKSGQ